MIRNNLKIKIRDTPLYEFAFAILQYMYVPWKNPHLNIHFRCKAIWLFLPFWQLNVPFPHQFPFRKKIASKQYLQSFQQKMFRVTSESFEHPSYRYQAMVSIPTVVMTPPKQPNLSQRMVSAPALALEIAAERPLGPPPTTRTSHLAKMGTFLGVSRNRYSTYYVYIMYNCAFD